MILSSLLIPVEFSQQYFPFEASSAMLMVPEVTLGTYAASQSKSFDPSDSSPLDIYEPEGYPWTLKDVENLFRPFTLFANNFYRVWPEEPMLFVHYTRPFASRARGPEPFLRLFFHGYAFLHISRSPAPTTPTGNPYMSQMMFMALSRHAIAWRARSCSATDCVSLQRE